MNLRSVALVVALGVGACTRAREARQDLLASPAEAELRSDTLDLSFLERNGALAQRGFGALEGRAGHRFVWTVGGRARVQLPFRTASDKQLRLRARCHEALGPHLPLELTLNDTPVATLTLTTQEQEFHVLLPGRAQAGDNLLTLTAARQREPPAGDPDRRTLVAAFSELDVRPLDAPRGATPPRWQGARLAVPEGAAVAYYIRVPQRARLRVSGSAGERRAALRIMLADDARSETLDTLAIGEGRASRTLSLEAWAGRLARVEIASLAGLTWLEELVLLSPGAAAESSALTPLDEPPHLVIYLVDTLRADRLGAYGHRAPTSPRFDAFAREALLFEDAWAQASWTRPATGSILTGLHPALHGADREDGALAPELTTLAEALKAAGYRTAAFVANHLVGGRFGFDQGFDHWNGGDERLYGAPAAALGERALAWLDQDRGPFFLYLHTLEPHSPYAPDPAYATPFAQPGYAGSRDTRSLLRLGQLGKLAPDGLRFLESQYQGEIRQNDAAFGALLDGLRSRNLLEHSVVVFTSDHGEELLEHGGTEHAKTLYQELLRVPLAVRLPGGKRGGSREAGAVQQIDLLPTLLRLTGLSAPGGLPGRDLAERWLGSDAPQPEPLLFAEERFTVISKAAVRAGTRKLILNSDGEALWRAGTQAELYDLERDPGERQNLVAQAPVSLRYLRQELERFRKLSAAARKGRTLTLTPTELEQLRALGYVQ